MISKKVIIVMIISLIYCAPLSAQYFELSNQTVFGGDADDRPADIIESDDGGYFILSSSSSGINGNKSAPNYGSSDYWLIKTDSLFNEIWQLSYGGDSFDTPTNLLKDIDGNLYLCGSSASDISGNKTVESYGYASYWVIKLDQSGNEVWQRAYGGDDDEVLHDALMFDNKLYLIGYSTSDSTGVKTGFNRGSKDYWLVCADTAGNVLWDKTYGGNEFDYPRGLVVDSSNDYLYIYGWSKSDISYEKSEPNIGQADLWLLKINASDGSLLTDKTIGSEQTDRSVYHGMVKHDDYLYMVSTSYGDISGYKTDSSRGSSDYWLVKTDLDFNPVWDKTIGGAAEDAISSLCMRDGLLIISGSSKSNAGFEKSENAYNQDYYDAWYVALDTSGPILWDKTIGGYGHETYNRIYNLDDLIFYSGTYDAYPSGDLSVPGYGMYDNWLFRMSVPLSGVEESVSELNASLYPNPATTQIHVQLPDARTAELSLYAISGKLLMKANIDGPQGNIDVSSLKSGMYMVEIHQNNTVKRAKLVVE